MRLLFVRVSEGVFQVVNLILLSDGLFHLLNVIKLPGCMNPI